MREAKTLPRHLAPHKLNFHSVRYKSPNEIIVLFALFVLLWSEDFGGKALK